MEPYDRREEAPSTRPPAREPSLESLKQENASLKQLVVKLSELVIRKIAERH